MTRESVSACVLLSITRQVMKKCILVVVLAAALVAGCAPYIPTVLLPSHPASVEADAAPTYLPSTTLDVVSGSNDKTDTKDKMAKDGPTMGEMHHAGH